jgi:hypothetical protein
VEDFLHGVDQGENVGHAFHIGYVSAALPACQHLRAPIFPPAVDRNTIWPYHAFVTEHVTRRERKAALELLRAIHANGLTLRGAAELAEVDVAHLSRITNGKARPSLDLAGRIERLWRVPVTLWTR